MNQDNALIEQAQLVRTRYEAQLLKKANVVGVGVGFRERGGKLTEQVVLVVSVTKKKPMSQLADADVIPPVIEGIPVDVREVGEMKAW